MSGLAEIQRALAASLIAGAPVPPGCDPEALAHAARALRRKRREAVRQLLPRLWAQLGSHAPSRFEAHVARYQPAGLLPHVDDAWVFAERLLADADRSIRDAARMELFHLRLHYRRLPATDPRRIVERRGIFVALHPGEPGGLVVQVGRRSWSLGLPRFRRDRATRDEPAMQ